MANNVSFGTLVDPEQADIDRRRALAQALQQKAMDPIPQQTAGGMTVAQSPLEGVSRLASALMAGRKNKELDAEQVTHNDKKRARGAEEVQGIIDALRGKAAVPEAQGNNPSAYQPAQAAQGPDTAKAMALALKSENPMAQGIGGSLLTSMMPKAAKMEKVEIPDGNGGKKVGFVDMNSPNPMSTFQAGGMDPAKGIAVNGRITSPYQMGTEVPKQPDAPNAGTNLVLPGPNGTMIPNQPLIDARKAVAKAGASNTQVSVNTAMKPLLSEVGKGAGEQINNDFAGARAAQQVLQNVDQIKAGLGNAILGPGANVRVKLGQIGQVLGVNGKDSTEQLQNTRSVMQGLARQELAAAGAMKGQGQITESERGILRRAESGQIDEMTKPEVETLLTALTKTAQYRIGVHSQNLERLGKDPHAADVVKFMQLPGGAGGGQKSVLEQADAILNGGR